MRGPAEQLHQPRREYLEVLDPGTGPAPPVTRQAAGRVRRRCRAERRAQCHRWQPCGSAAGRGRPTRIRSVWRPALRDVGWRTNQTSDEAGSERAAAARASRGTTSRRPRSPERRRHRLRQRIAPLDLLAHRHPFDDQAVPMVIVETRGGIESPQSSDVRSAGAESRRSSFRCRWHVPRLRVGGPTRPYPENASWPSQSGGVGEWAVHPRHQPA